MPVPLSDGNPSHRFALAAGLALALASPSTAVEPDPIKVDLFRAETGGYAIYRIPGLVATNKGTLLAYCEARREARGDWGPTDILLRRSIDGGGTWLEPKVIARVDGPPTKNPAALAQKLGDPGDVTYHNPVAIADEATGTVHFVFGLEYMRCFYQRSDDDGLTFTAAAEITATFEAFRKHYDWKVIATGPGHGIRLNNGRLLVPVWLSIGTGGHAHRPSVAATITSDDDGETWQPGEIVADATDPLINPSETAAVQLADGRVMLNIRSESKANRRALATSSDGATDWTRPVFDDNLPEPICFGSLCRLTEPDGRRRLLFVNPDNLDRADGRADPGRPRDRKNLTVRLSDDEGRTWPVAKVIEPGPSAYADLAVSPDGGIFCFYERGRNEALTLARFESSWLTERNGPQIKEIQFEFP